MISGYGKLLFIGSVLRMLRPYNSGIVDDAAESGKDLAIQPEKPTLTFLPALAARLIYR